MDKEDTPVHQTTPIHPVKIEKHTENYKKAKHTFKTAFPKKEQVPFWSLQLLAKNSEVDTLAWHDDKDAYVGMSYSIHHEGKLMILYLALDDIARNKGYGTWIINYLQNKDNITQTVLDIESPMQVSDNTPQRQRRLHFYQKLGFYSTDQEIIEPACHYLILGTTQNRQEAVDTYVDLTAKLTANMCHLHIENAKKEH